MKKLLLGTTMLVGAAMASTGAFAQSATNPVTTASPYNVTLRGFATFLFQNLNEGSGPSSAAVTPNQMTYKFSSQQRFSILADAKADNGLQYGIFMRFDAGQAGGANTLSNNRSWAYIQGGWGKIYVGERNPALGDTLGYTTGGGFGFGPPTGDTFGPNSGFSTNPLVRSAPGFLDNLAGGVTDFGNARQRMIRYDSPTVYGFHIVSEYAPEPGQLFRSPNRNAQVAGSDVTAAGSGTVEANHLGLNGYRDLVQLAIDYQGTFGPVGFEAGVGGEYAKAKQTGIGSALQFNNFAGVMGDVRVTYAGFALQLNASDEFDSRYAKRTPTATFYKAPDQWGASTNLSYTVGPYTVGVAYGYAQSGGDPFVPGSNRYQDIAVGGHYIVAKGLMLFAGADFISLKGEQGQARVGVVPNNSPTVVSVGTHISF